MNNENIIRISVRKDEKDDVLSILSKIINYKESRKEDTKFYSIIYNQVKDYGAMLFTGEYVEDYMGLLQNPIGDGDPEDVYLDEPSGESVLRERLFNLLKSYVDDAKKRNGQQ